MNHSKVAILSECADKDLAEKLRHDFSTRKYNVTLFNELSFPREETVLPFLSEISSKYDLIFLVISDNSNYLHWINKKVKSEKLLGHFQNIYPAYFIS